ncbi:hypothetical protein [Faecalibacter macacae]|uniref:Uncharacterized protein n=1 Tax=Faecalibacter macacae TaxID=1859289 RepID=A0A3L9M0P1_9FLAO|nr:hypothetical protein [Faecalibacter macacae]RLZ06478.1 hypothetical protein EAH69_13420 [Faecalibacter macacae]
MVKLYQKVLTIAALILLQGLQAQVGISHDMNFVPDPDLSLHVDGKLNVRGKFKSTTEPDQNIGNGQKDQLLQMKIVDNKLTPQWVNPPISLLEQGMYYIENTYTTTNTSGAIFNSKDTNSYVNANIENETFSNGWKKIAEFSDKNSLKNFNILKSNNNINIRIETGVELRNTTSNNIANSSNVQYACGLFSKTNGESDSTAKLRAYRIGQVNWIRNQTIQHSNFNLLYTLENFPIGEYNFFVACKKMNQSVNSLELRIGQPNHSGISQFTDRPIVNLDILYKL